MNNYSVENYIKDIRRVIIEEVSQKSITERIKLVEKLNKIKCVIKVFPSNSNFILVEFDDANKIYNQLIDNKIVVRNRSNIEGCNNCLRITVGTPKQNEILIKTLNNL